MVSMVRRRFRAHFEIMFRMLDCLVFLGFVSAMAVLFVIYGLTVSDLFASILGFVPTGWCILLVSETSIYQLV